MRCTRRSSGQVVCTPEPAPEAEPWCGPDDPLMEAQQCGGGGNSLAQERLGEVRPEPGWFDDGGPVGLGGPWEQFALVFNDEFRSVLHAFRPREAAPECSEEEVETTVSTPGGHPRERSGEDLDADTLRALFTDRQREQITAFHHTRYIPDRLFNGDEAGGTTAQQRLLLSAHILSTGVYEPGSELEQEVHARMCYHWVQLVHHYAGVTTGTASGVMGTFDHEGNVVLGSGRAEGVFQRRGVSADDLPATESPGAVGPVPPGTGHAQALERERAARAADPTVEGRIHRRPGLPFARFAEIQPGDWLWYYNANGSPGGSHSVIFSRWTSGPRGTPETALYQEAICFSQADSADGGREHTVRLGDRYAEVDGGRVYPITHVSRVGADARPATTPEELLPAGRDAARVSEANRRFLAVRGRTVGHEIDVDRLEDWLRERNRGLIASLDAERVTPGQQALLEEANASEELEMLVRLNQRLGALARNQGVLERNEAATFDDDLRSRHDAAEAEARREEEEIQRELDAIDAELDPLHRELEERTTRLDALEQDDEIRGLRRQVGAVWSQMRALPRGPERQALQQHRQDLLAEIAALQAQEDGHRPEIRRLAAEIADRRREARPLERRRRRFETRQAAVREDLPYGLTHPGNLSEQVRGGVNGRLAELDPQPPWAELVVGEAPEASVAAP